MPRTELRIEIFSHYDPAGNFAGRRRQEAIEMDRSVERDRLFLHERNGGVARVHTITGVFNLRYRRSMPCVDYSYARDFLIRLPGFLERLLLAGIRIVLIEVA